MSYESDYTRGEWFIKDGVAGKSILSLRPIAGIDTIVPLIKNQFKEDETNANAKLIAAAPKMFELLKKIFETMDKGTQTYIEIQQLLTEITK